MLWFLVDINKDSVYFADKSMKQLFDQTVENAYQQSMVAPVLDQEEMEEDMDPEEEAGLSMEM